MNGSGTLTRERLVRRPVTHEPARRGNSERKALLPIAWALGGFSFAAAAAGLLWRGSGESFSVTTLRGQAAEIYGRGLYENDTLFVVGNNAGSDLVTLLIALPLLAIATRMFLRGSLRGQLLLLGTFGYFVYYGAGYALGAVAFNELFLVYVATFSLSVFGLVAAFASVDRRRLALVVESFPRRFVGRFMIASGVVTLAIWLMEPVGSLLTGDVPKRLGTHTTLFTHALDIGVIVPAAVLAGVLILRRHTLGYVVAFSLLVLEALLMPLITIATIVQIELGLDFTPGEVVGPVAGFSTFALLAGYLVFDMLRRIPRHEEASR